MYKSIDFKISTCPRVRELADCGNLIDSEEADILFSTPILDTWLSKVINGKTVVEDYMPRVYSSSLVEDDMVIGKIIPLEFESSPKFIKPTSNTLQSLPLRSFKALVNNFNILSSLYIYYDDDDKIASILDGTVKEGSNVPPEGSMSAGSSLQFASNFCELDLHDVEVPYHIQLNRLNILKRGRGSLSIKNFSEPLFNDGCIEIYKNYLNQNIGNGLIMSDIDFFNQCLSSNPFVYTDDLWKVPYEYQGIFDQTGLIENSTNSDEIIVKNFSDGLIDPVLVIESSAPIEQISLSGSIYIKMK